MLPAEHGEEDRSPQRGNCDPQIQMPYGQVLDGTQLPAELALLVKVLE